MNPLPTSREAWLNEIAGALRDAADAGQRGAAGNAATDHDHFCRDPLHCDGRRSTRTFGVAPPVEAAGYFNHDEEPTGGFEHRRYRIDDRRVPVRRKQSGYFSVPAVP